jgi:predicted MarR family transcription regulator
LNGKNTIVVINALGQMVKTVETENSTEVLNVETIPNGMYQLRILQNETIIHNTKFAKTK